MGSPILFKDLFRTVLTAPLESASAPDTLQVVSGYATAALAAHHLLAAKAMGRLLSIDLVYGMAGANGVNQANHKGFLSLASKSEFSFPGDFSCAYVRRPASIHSKVYVWCRGNTPLLAFAGSANYTEMGFNCSNRTESLVSCDPQSAIDFFLSAHDQAIDCRKAEVGMLSAKIPGNWPQPIGSSAISIETDPESPYKGCPKVTVSLLVEKGPKAGSVGEGYRLNWGVLSDGTPRRNRKDDPSSPARDPNQAYIALPTSVQRSGFFPAYNANARHKNEQIRFNLVTDDGQVFSCVRASGDYGKEIETPQNNSELGLYFRRRLGLAPGTFIRAEDLERYGRTNLVFHKLDGETFAMDFSPPLRQKA